MEQHLKSISDLIDNQENLEDEKRFKVASASLVFCIVDIENQDSKKYFKLFENNLNLSEREFNSIRNELSTDKLALDEKITYIKDALNNNMFQVMQFLKILNKFAIADGCHHRNYKEFEKIRDSFLGEMY